MDGENMSEIVFKTKLKQRIDTSAQWKLGNPILLNGEIGIESDTQRVKFGDGVTAWNDLVYGAFVEFKDIIFSHTDPNPTVLCKFPIGFYLNEMSIEVVQDFDDIVSISIGTDENQSLLLDNDSIDITDIGTIYNYHYGLRFNDETPIKLFIIGTRSSGVLKISFK